MTLYVSPACHSVVSVGSRILGAQTSLAASSTGAARIVEDAERRRAVKAVINFIVKEVFDSVRRVVVCRMCVCERGRGGSGGG